MHGGQKRHRWPEQDSRCHYYAVYLHIHEVI